MFWEDFKEELHSILESIVPSVIICAILLGVIYAICCLAKSGQIVLAILTGLGGIVLLAVLFSLLFAFIDNHKY